jgi:hypothetical protein
MAIAETLISTRENRVTAPETEWKGAEGILHLENGKAYKMRTQAGQLLYTIDTDRALTLFDLNLIVGRPSGPGKPIRLFVAPWATVSQIRYQMSLPPRRVSVCNAPNVVKVGPATHWHVPLLPMLRKKPKKEPRAYEETI